MKFAIVGMGVQGAKRQASAGDEAGPTVDPVAGKASYRHISDVPLGDYDAAMVCTPDAAKGDVLAYLLENGKHVLVEKPLLTVGGHDLSSLGETARTHGAVLYVAYNHRFEPMIARMKQVLDAGTLGEIYAVRLHYGNGTARLVRDSVWRDEGAGVLFDLGSHLLDTLRFWFGPDLPPLAAQSFNRFENRAYDYFTCGAMGPPNLQLEMSLVTWRNHFVADVYAERGSAHIESFCKWDGSRFTQRERVLPSGVPPETVETASPPDPTWALEFAHFRKLCRDPRADAGRSIEDDIWIERTLAGIYHQAQAAEAPRVAAQ